MAWVQTPICLSPKPALLVLNISPIDCLLSNHLKAPLNIEIIILYGRTIQSEPKEKPQNL